VLGSLGGNWELIWTTQDKSTKEGGQSPLFNWINPLENQSYSNNPDISQLGGRSNPILPQNIQNKLEDLGILKRQPSENSEEKDGMKPDEKNPVRSSQAIDLKNRRVRNVVSFEASTDKIPMLPLPFPSPGESIRGLVTVDVKFKPNIDDDRRVDVKFEACRLSIRNSPLDINFPLGIIGPTGWLRTGYIDDDIRITRGHKGSVFILSRTSKTSAPKQ